MRLYHERWEIEITYLALRHTLLKGRVLRSKDPVGLNQEMWGLLTLYQALRSVMVTAVETIPGCDPDRAGFIVALEAARDTVVSLVGTTAASGPSSRSDLVGHIGARVLHALLPGRRMRLSARIVKCMMAATTVSARLSAVRGPKVSLLVGAVVATSGYALGIVLMHSVWEVILTAVMISAGIALAYSAMPMLIMSTVPLSETAGANGVNALMRAIGTSTSSAVIGTVLARTSRTFGDGSVPSMTGFRLSFAVAAGVGLTAVLVAAAIPSGKRSRRSPGHGPAAAARQGAPGDPETADRGA